MKKIQNRILLFFTVVLLSFSAFFYQLASSTLRNDSINQQEKALLTQLKTLESQLTPLDSLNIEETEYINQLHIASEVIEERITLISLTGEVLYDSHIPFQSLENHLERPEIKQITNGAAFGKYYRKSKSTGEILYYSAIPIFTKDQRIIGYIRLSKNEKNMVNLSEDFNKVLGVFILSSIVITFLFIKFWSDKITTPIDQIKNVANELSKQNYSARYSPGFYQEIDDLGHTINILAVNLKNQMTEIKETEVKLRELINHLVIGVIVVENNKQITMVNPIANELLGEDLNSKKEGHFQNFFQSSELTSLVEKSFASHQVQNKEIKLYFPIEKNVNVHVVPIFDEDKKPLNFIILLYDITEIKKLEKVRSDFVANVSHELRTPITALQGFSETLLDGALHDEDVLVDFLKIINKEAKRLNTMVNDLLHLSKLEGKQEHRIKELVNVKEIVKEVISILNQKIEMKEIAIHITVKEDLDIEINPDEFKQIIINLLSNAVSYTPQKGEIMIQIERSEKKLLLSIADTGIGIPPNQINRIFERFYRVDKGRSRNLGGTGLGLSIVKWLVDNNNGDIKVDSVLEKGTCFTIELPLS